MITYSSKLNGSQEDLLALKELLEMQRTAFNFASNIQFKQSKISIVILHSEVYRKFRRLYPDIPAQVVIRAEQEVLSSYRSVKSNKHKIESPINKKLLSMRLDERLYSRIDNNTIRITTSNKRKQFTITGYPKLNELMTKYRYLDPFIYVKNKELYIAFTFENKKEPIKKQKLCLGVDLGMRRPAACSDGRLIIDKKFNKEKRRLRYLKRQLQSCGSKSARKRLKKQLQKKEFYHSKNQTHLIANSILNTKADTIALENLKGIKKKKYKYQNKRAIAQVPLFELRRVITYKAENIGKHVLLVRPSYTSQTDSVTGKIKGERRGCRFYSNSGVIYDSDINAAINVAKLSKLPISQTNNLTYGQALINRPIACKSIASNGDSIVNLH